MTSHRYLRHGLSAAMVIAAVALAPATAAYAQTGHPEAIAFTGGCATDEGVAAQAVVAEPGRLNLAPGSEVRLVNRLTRGATVLVDGQDAVRLPADGFVVLRIHDGPVEVALRISCPSGPVAGLATIGVVEGGVAPVMPPDLLSRLLAQQHDGSAPPPDRPGVDAEDPGDAGNGDESGPAGDVDSDSEEAEEWAEEQLEERAAVIGDPMAGGPNGLLALVAAACVAGVSAGVIRTIWARRETQS